MVIPDPAPTKNLEINIQYLTLSAGNISKHEYIRLAMQNINMEKSIGSLTDLIRLLQYPIGGLNII